MATMQNPEMRRARMSVLARCDSGALRRLWDSLGLKAEHKPLRGPETGLVMLRGRVGGTGAPFNVGEATVTRATVKLSDGSVGHAMAFGRDGEKARLSAVIDALCLKLETAALIDAGIIDPLRRQLQEDDARRREETAATRVDFFTMVRGED